jgi:hypothetical protein
MSEQQRLDLLRYLFELGSSMRGLTHQQLRFDAKSRQLRV